MTPPLRHPSTGTALIADGPHSLAGSGERFPVIDGIAYLRPGREALAGAALDALDRGDRMGALALLLADRDDHAKGPPPDPEACARVARSEATTLREAMDALGYGPVGTYFAYRWSAPTFLSALALLGRYWRPEQPVVEIACGLGQILREVALAGGRAVGTDLVFSKLWLARRFVVPEGVGLVCADAAAPVLDAGGPAAVLCHDALYFIEDKAAVLAAMRRLAGADGAVLVGHAHNALVDQRGVAGTPLAPEAWAALMPDAALYDDAALAEAWAGGGQAAPQAPAALAGSEALALAEGTPHAADAPVGLPRPGRPLRLNPLFVDGDDHRLHPVWPTPRIAEEYASAGYLAPLAPPPAAVMARAAAGEVTPEIEALARRRVLVDLPEAW